METVQLKTTQVVVGKRIRTDLGDISELASSIATNGQIHPISVAPINGGDTYALVSGLRRLKACELLQVPVRAEIVKVLPDDIARLKCEIDENLKRKAFDALEEGEGLRRMKEAYEESTPGLNKRGRKPKGSEDVVAPVRFTLAAAKDLGYSERKVQELLAIADLPKEYKRLIEGAETSAERNRVAQQCLAKIRQQNKIEKLQERADLLNQGAEPTPFNVRLIEGDNSDYWIGEELYDVILTDPPYDRKRSSIAHAARATINPKDFDWDKLDTGWVLKAAPLLRKGGHLLVFAPLEAIGEYETICEAAGLEYRQSLLWIKSNPAPTHRPVYATAVEAIVWATKPGAPYHYSSEVAKAGADSTNVFYGASTPGSATDRVHPTQKPEWLVTRLLNTHASMALGHTVFDPFAGSGTTGVAAKKIGLSCVMVERDPEYARLARLRLEATV